MRFFALPNRLNAIDIIKGNDLDLLFAAQTERGTQLVRICIERVQYPSNGLMSEVYGITPVAVHCICKSIILKSTSFSLPFTPAQCHFAPNLLNYRAKNTRFATDQSTQYPIGQSSSSSFLSVKYLSAPVLRRCSYLNVEFVRISIMGP
jgi:hypothetical protein